LFACISKQGLVSYVDFKKVFKKSDDDLESHIAEGSSSNFEQVMPKTIPELADGNKVTYLIMRLGSSFMFTKFYRVPRLNLILCITYITAVKSRGGYCAVRGYTAVVQS
jgi:hypothetical protein